MSLTKSPSAGLLVGQSPPRVRHAPSVRANGWEDVADLSASLGVVLDEWQEAVLQAAMGERADGKWAARIVGVSAPRQQGKSQLIVARALAGVLLFDEKTIIVSAHQTDTAREVFQRLLDIIDDNPAVSSRVESVMKALNREFVRFKGGQTIKIKARSIGGSRGFSADCLLLDEAQILGRPAWSSILPTMSARENPQAWLLGTPPTPADDGEVFAGIREQGMTGKGQRMAYVEWSAEPTDDLDDPATWAKANPAYGTRILREAIEAERSSMSDDQFSLERLGMWEHATRAQIIDAQTWALQADPASMPIDRLTLAIDVAPQREVAAVSLAGLRPDDVWHVELYEHRSGVDWVIPYVKERAERNTLHAVVVDEIAGLTEKRNGRNYLKGTDIEVTLMGAEGRDAAMAWAAYKDGILAGTVKHTDQPQVNVALTQAGTRDVGGGKALSKKASESDITPLTSQTFALWGAQRDDVKKPHRSWGTKTKSGGGGGGGWVM